MKKSPQGKAAPGRRLPVLKAAKSFLRRLGALLSNLFRKFFRDQCMIRAAGLAFSFLLAFIPLLALVLSLFSGFGAFESAISEIRSFFVETMLPAKQEQLVGIIDQLTDNTKALGIFGLITFLFTSIIFLINVENNFNSIWGTRTNKKFISRFTSNTSVLVLGTLLLGASFSLSDVTNDILSLLNPSRTPVLNDFFQQLFSFLFMILTLLLLIMIVPATRVQLRSALSGAVTGAVIWEVAKRLFGFWTESSIQYSRIYGSLALIPIFLIWLYIGWLVVLLALELTYTLQYRENPLNGGVWPDQFCSLKLLVGVQLFLQIARGFRQGKAPYTLQVLSREFDMNYIDVKVIAEALAGGGLLLPFEAATGQLIPAKDLSTIQLADVAECLFGSLPTKVRDKSWAPALQLVRDFKRNAFSGLDGTSVLDFLNTHYPGRRA